MPTDYRSMFDKDFLGAWDFPEGDRTFTIKKCQRGELVGQGGRKTKKPVLYFEETDKGMALNATNGKTIAALYGVMVEEWRGKKIALYKSRTTMGSEEVDCIRIRPQAPRGNGAVEDDSGEVITADQAIELEQLCKEGGRDLTIDLLKASKIESIEYLQAVRYKNAKAWIQKQRLAEHEGTQA